MHLCQAFVIAVIFLVKLTRSFSQKIKFIQDNESKSSFGVLRGLHYQLAPYAQSKLVRVSKGEVLDVALDIRSGSPTFGQHATRILSEENSQYYAHIGGRVIMDGIEMLKSATMQFENYSLFLN